MTQYSSSRVTKALLAVLTLPVAQSSFAQLEELIVTSSKRIETLKEVPVSVSVISAEMMKQGGITDLAEAAAYIPNFEASDSSILPNLYVRGIGSGTTHSIEQSVGRFVDEVYIGRAAINLHGFMDVSSVEVLRGPQGTLFGKNTLGGAIIVDTADPTEDFDLGLDTTVSEYSTVGGRTEFSGFVSGALAESLRARVAFQWKDKEGYVENRLPGPDGGTREDYGIRAKFDWDAGENTLIKLKLEHQEYEEEGQIPSETVSGTFPGGPSAGQPMTEAFLQQYSPGFSFERDWKMDIDCEATLGPNNETFCPARDQDSQNVTLKIEHELVDIGTITAISGYQAYEFDHDFVAIDQGIVGGSVRANRAETYSGFSQEIRFTSEEYDHYDYIVGLYFEDSELERLQRSDFNVPDFLGAPPPASGFAASGPPYDSRREDWQQDTQTIAVFGQFRWNITEEVTAIFGGRWSTEEKDFYFEDAFVPYQDDPIPFTDAVIDESRSESKFTPSLTLRYEPGGDHMVYATISQGHKTGGFSDRRQTPVDFDEELNTSIEIGLKSFFMEGSLETNFALYHMEIEDLQVARALPGNTTNFEVRNAAEATSQGLEFDGRWLISEHWILGGSFAYTDATFDDFPGASTSCPEIGGSLEGALCNFGGLPLIFAPEYKGTVFLEYEDKDFVAGWGLNSRITASYSDEYYPEINYIESLKQDEYTTWDASVRLMSPDDHWTVALIGRNLTEEHVIAFGLQAGFTEYVAPKAPREIALQVSYRY